MKTSRVLKMASAPAFLLSVGLVAACDDTTKEPAVDEPAVHEEPAQPQQPGQTSPGQSPTMQEEPAEEPDEGVPPADENEGGQRQH